MKTPWHLWVVAIAATLWNLGGVIDYLMSQLQIVSYLGAMSPEQRAYFDGFPAWAVAFWAFGVWGAMAGSLLLLLRSRLAAPAFLIGLIGLLINTIRLVVTEGGKAMDLLGSTGLLFTAILIIVSILLWLYARAMVTRGVLR